MSYSFNHGTQSSRSNLMNVQASLNRNEAAIRRDIPVGQNDFYKTMLNSAASACANDYMYNNSVETSSMLLGVPTNLALMEMNGNDTPLDLRRRADGSGFMLKHQNMAPSIEREAIFDTRAAHGYHFSNEPAFGYGTKFEEELKKINNNKIRFNNDELLFNEEFNPYLPISDSNMPRYMKNGNDGPILSDQIREHVFDREYLDEDSQIRLSADMKNNQAFRERQMKSLEASLRWRGQPTALMMYPKYSYTYSKNMPTEGYGDLRFNQLNRTNDTTFVKSPVIGSHGTRVMRNDDVDNRNVITEGYDTVPSTLLKPIQLNNKPVKRIDNEPDNRSLLSHLGESIMSLVPQSLMNIFVTKDNATANNMMLTSNAMNRQQNNLQSYLPDQRSLMGNNTRKRYVVRVTENKQMYLNEDLGDLANTFITRDGHGLLSVMSLRANPDGTLSCIKQYSKAAFSNMKDYDRLDLPSYYEYNIPSSYLSPKSLELMKTRRLQNGTLKLSYNEMEHVMVDIGAIPENMMKTLVTRHYDVNKMGRKDNTTDIFMTDGAFIDSAVLNDQEALRSLLPQHTWKLSGRMNQFRDHIDENTGDIRRNNVIDTYQPSNTRYDSLVVPIVTNSNVMSKTNINVKRFR